jgi:hypothetical protein
MMKPTSVRVSLVVAALLAAKVSAFVSPSGSTARLSHVLRAEAELFDLGEIVSTAKEAFTDVTDSVEAISDNWADGVGSLSDNLDGAGGLLVSFPPEMIGIVALGVLGLAAIAAVVSGGKSGTESNTGSSTSTNSPSKSPPKPKEKKADVSIPYDAAARLAYDAWVATNEGVKTSEETYAAFKTMYEDTVIAEVTAKQKARDLANFDPNKPKPKPRPTLPPAVVSVATTKRASTTTATSIPFFADAKA